MSCFWISTFFCTGRQANMRERERERERESERERERKVNR